MATESWGPKHIAPRTPVRVQMPVEGVDAGVVQSRNGEYYLVLLENGVTVERYLVELTVTGPQLPEPEPEDPEEEAHTLYEQLSAELKALTDRRLSAARPEVEELVRELLGEQYRHWRQTPRSEE